MINEIILASASIRRAEILNQVAIEYEIILGDFDENTIQIHNPIEYVKTLAFKKAESVPCSSNEKRCVLGADTVVVINQTILEKPSSIEEAKDYLRLLSNSDHEVYTGVSIYRPWDKRTITDYQVTVVSFDTLTEEDIDFYVSTKEPFDKAGGYGIQGIGARFIREIKGDYFNVVGLPVNLVIKMLKEMGEVDETKSTII